MVKKKSKSKTKAPKRTYDPVKQLDALQKAGVADYTKEELRVDAGKYAQAARLSFLLLDEDHKGELTLAEMQNVLENLPAPMDEATDDAGFIATVPRGELPYEELFNSLDTEKYHTLDALEFSALFHRAYEIADDDPGSWHGTRRDIQIHVLLAKGVETYTPEAILTQRKEFCFASKYCFKLVDVDSTGFITKPELVQTFDGVAGIDEAYIDSVYDELDTDGNGNLDKLEFSVLFRDVAEKAQASNPDKPLMKGWRKRRVFKARKSKKSDPDRQARWGSSSKARKTDRKKLLSALKKKHVDDYTSEEVLNDPRKFIDAAHYAFLVADSDSKGTLSKNEVTDALSGGDGVDDSLVSTLFDQINATHGYFNLDLFEFAVLYRRALAAGFSLSEEAEEKATSKGKNSTKKKKKTKPPADDEEEEESY